MKKIGIIAVCDYVSLPNGGEVFLLNNFLTANSNLGIEYSLIGMTFDDSKTVGKWTKLKIGKNEYNFLPVSKVLKDKEKTHIPFRVRVVAGLYKYWKAIEEKGIKEVYVHSAELGIPFWKKKDISLSYHVHGDPGQTLKYSRFVAFRGHKWTDLYYYVIKHTIEKSKLIIWAANRSKQLYLNAQPRMKEEVERKSIVIHSSFDAKLTVSNEQQLTLKNRLHLVTVARLAAIKRIDFIIEVVASLVEDKYDVDLLVCGDGEQRKNLEDLAKQLNISDRVIFLGLLNRKQLAEALDRSEVFLFASESEAMSLVVLESLYMGTPVVSTDVGDLEDVVLDGKTGYIIREYNNQKYKEKVCEVLNKGKSFYSENCRILAGRFTPEAMADKINKALE